MSIFGRVTGEERENINPINERTPLIRVENSNEEHCFKKCIVTKGASLSGDKLDYSEQKCISMCRDRYQDTVKAVEQALRQRRLSSPPLVISKIERKIPPTTAPFIAVLSRRSNVHEKHLCVSAVHKAGSGVEVHSRPHTLPVTKR